MNLYLVRLSCGNGSESVARNFAGSGFRKARYDDDVFEAGDRTDVFAHFSDYLFDDFGLSYVRI